MRLLPAFNDKEVAISAIKKIFEIVEDWLSSRGSEKWVKVTLNKDDFPPSEHSMKEDVYVEDVLGQIFEERNE